MKNIMILWIYPLNTPDKITGSYVAGVKISNDGSCEQVDNDSDADMFSIYLRDNEGCSFCFADFLDRKSADEFLSHIQF